jgi:radical SAM superfamily enzyme YgiQ (UPF0313 family)
MRYEIGPIRPPNEAYSLLVRFTRNCPWNQCAFCHSYKGKRFEKRPVEEIKEDIDIIGKMQDDIIALSEEKGFGGAINDRLIDLIFGTGAYSECFKSVAIWLYFGGKNVFIQDANSLAMKSEDFIEALRYLKEKFPSIDRVTSYARSRTIAKRLTVDELVKIREAGLTRLHVGMETGNNFLLKYMSKGVTKEEQVECGRKVKEAGIELSEYVVLGLGGRRWWKEHATDTAEVLNRINPDFIRFRTLKVLRDMPLYKKVEAGEFLILHEEEILTEERLLLEKLEGITSYVKSDHILNLLEEVDGKLPEDKEHMLSVIDAYQALNGEQRLIYRFGRRAGMYRSTDNLQDELTYLRIKKTIREIEQQEPGSVERTLSLLLENYI